MNIQSPQIITASTKVSPELAERAHTFAVSWLTGTPTALIMPTWPLVLQEKRERLSREFPIGQDCPLLSIILSEAALASLAGKVMCRTHGVIITFRDKVDQETQQVNVLVFNLTIAEKTFTLLFDIGEETTNAALRRWMALGFIPAYCRDRDRSYLVKLALDKTLGIDLERDERGLVPGSLVRFSLCATVADPNLTAPWLPANRVTMLVTAPESLPHAFGLCEQSAIQDGASITRGDIVLIVP